MRQISQELLRSQDSKQSQVSSRVFISNCNINENMNIDTTILYPITSTETQISISGDYSDFTGYVVIENEIIKVTNSYYSDLNTIFEIQRAKYNTTAAPHNAGEIIRDVTLLRVATWEYSDESSSTSTSIFSPALSTGTIKLTDDIKKYDIESDTRIYNIRKNKYIYIFNGIPTQLICCFIGYIYRSYSQNLFEYIIELRDRFNMYWNEDIDLNMTFSNISIKTLLSAVLSIPESMIEYANGTTDADYFMVDEISTNEFTTYIEFLQALCSSCLFRMCFSETGKLRIFSDVYTGNIATQKILTTKNYTDVSASSDDNRVAINKVSCAYTERKELFNMESFKKNGKIQYVNFEYNQKVLLQLIDNVGFVENTINISPYTNIKYINSSPDFYLMLQDNITKSEFYCKATDIDISGNIKIIGGFDKDRKWLNLGKFNHLVSLGYSSPRSFTLYYGATELPTVFALNIDNETDTDLRIPILPQEELKYSCKFGAPTVENREFSGIIKGIDNIFSGTFTNAELGYLQRYKQNDNSLPIYLQTNKIGTMGYGESQYTILNSFDNTNIELRIEKATNNEDDFNLYIKNTLTGVYTTAYPTQVLGSSIIVSNINNFTTGDTLSLSDSNDLVPQRSELYLKLKGEKWIIRNKFVSTDGYHFLTLDKPFPIGTDNSNFEFKKYEYSSIILLNEFYIKGNPVLQQIQNVESIDSESIAQYGKQEYSIDGRFVNIDNLAYGVDYLKNGFNRNSQISRKRYIEFSVAANYDLQLLDTVIFKDSVVLNYSDKKFTIISKSVYCDGVTETKFKAISTNEYQVSKAELTLENKVSYLPISIPIYNHMGNSGFTNIEPINLDNSILSLTNNKIGIFTLLKINGNLYSANSATNVRNGFLELQISSITGSLNIYNILLLFSGKRCVLKINDEYLLVEGISSIDASTTSTAVKIIERDLFSTGQSEISIGQTIEFYQILQISGKDGIYTTNTIIGDKDSGKYFEFQDGRLDLRCDTGYIGSDVTYFDITNGKFKINSDNISNIFQIGNIDESNLSYNSTDGLSVYGNINISGNKGQINFIDSNLILNDFNLSLPNTSGIILNDGRIFTNVNDAVFSVYTYFGTSSILSFGHYSDTFVVNNSNTGTLIRNAYKSIEITGITVPDNSTNLGIKNGMLSYHNGHFFGMINGIWKQLDN